MRGFTSIGFISQKDVKNTGALLRAAHCYDAKLLVFQSPKDVVHDYLNTSKAERQIPTIFTDDIKKCIPHGAKVVVIEVGVSASRPLTTFDHPEQAFYIFGPEGGSVPEDIIAIADEVVYVPTTICMNLACCANVVLYDRLLKSVPKGPEAREELTAPSKPDGSP